jgi:hypothetical protein
MQRAFILLQPLFPYLVDASKLLKVVIHLHADNLQLVEATLLATAGLPAHCFHETSLPHISSILSSDPR